MWKHGKDHRKFLFVVSKNLSGMWMSRVSTNLLKKNVQKFSAENQQSCAEISCPISCNLKVRPIQSAIAASTDLYFIASEQRSMQWTNLTADSVQLKNFKLRVSLFESRRTPLEIWTQLNSKEKTEVHCTHPHRRSLAVPLVKFIVVSLRQHSESDHSQDPCQAQATRTLHLW